MDIFSDLKIADEIRAALQHDPLISRSDVGITVSGGEVSLSGKVDSYFDSLHAQEVLAGVAGVKKVRNRLAIRNFLSAKSDGEISDAIQTQFWQSPMVYVEAAGISVENGVATLSGIVRSIDDFESARQRAYDAGAKRVQNRLEIRD
jgi:osmotically-inducible protein OsmY